MKPSFQDLRTDMPEVDERLLKGHLDRLGDDYFKGFTAGDVKNHLEAIARISPRHPVEIILNQRRDQSVECTILAFDYPSEFSLITGILAGMGFNIISGDVYTYKRIHGGPAKRDHKKKTIGQFPIRDLFNRRKIIDFFSGTLSTPMPLENWSNDLKNNLEDIIGLLEKGKEDSIDEARNRVNEMVVKHLASLNQESVPVLFPVEIDVDNDAGPFTRLRVVSEDTPAFLYSLSNALTLHDISIEHVRIRTIYGRIEDRIDLLDFRGRKIVEGETLDRIKLSVLLTKQFTYFLTKAPDPYTAISRFEKIVKDIVQQPFREKWISHLTDPRNLQGLARLLGASDFLWEDFIRLQYESLLPMFRHDVKGQMFSKSPEKMPVRMELILEGAGTLEEKKIRVNRFKDQETFLIDLDHILNPEYGFKFLAERLTRLAELVVNSAAEAVYNDLVKRYGAPGSVAGMDARYSILGLGKLGGAALGYASDIELLFVYSDNGYTDGRQSIDNSEFFNLFVKGVYQFIEAKREGIFQVDLRLRPYGNSGPLACSLESFCRYYGPEGNAHSYERLSLVRLRALGGDPALGDQLERIRDEIVYFSNSIDLGELRELRERQFREKNVPGKINAKFSPGGLVDLEYGVQALQALHGKDIPALRTARIHDSLQALSEAGVLSQGDSTRLIEAYNFLRNLINGLRMLRGSAKDLFLPQVEAGEFGHLARRMGYVRGGPLDSAQRLYMDLETHMAVVRVFAEKHFGRESLPSPETGTIVDVILSDEMSNELRYEILSKGGFRDPKRAYVNLKGLAGKGSRRETFAKIALLAWDIVKRTPDPDMALNNWDRFIRSLASPEFHYNILLSQPMQLEILLSLFSGSQFLSDTLVRNPGFLDWLIIPEILNPVRKREDIEGELRGAAAGCLTRMEWLNKLRRLRRREILRIGTRDIYMGISTRIIMMELSALAEACVQVILEERIKEEEKNEKSENERQKFGSRFCIMAFGKLGGNELNYSSDIDLLGVWGDPSEEAEKEKGDKEIFTRIMEGLVSDLSSHTEEGYAYRVDLRLRPFGSSGELVHGISGLTRYYRDKASLWEIQAALKLRPVAGDLRLGYELLKRLRPVLYRQRRREDITKTIEKMRKGGVRLSSKELAPTLDVKSGIGGIRDIEFMIQGLQLIHAEENPAIVEGNTMLAMEALAEAAILPPETTESLKEDYVFLRRTEHYLQILEDRQIHSLPENERELTALAKRMLGSEGSKDRFVDQLNSCLSRVRNAYNTYLHEPRNKG